MAVGATLQLKVDGDWQALGYFSKTLENSEINKSTFFRELLAIYLGIRHFQYVLETVSFKIFTDHRAILGAIKSKTNKHAPKEGVC